MVVGVAEVEVEVEFEVGVMMLALVLEGGIWFSFDTCCQRKWRVEREGRACGDQTTRNCWRGRGRGRGRGRK